MAHALSFTEQANALAAAFQVAIDPATSKSAEEKAGLSKAVNALALRILEAGSLDADRIQALSILDRAVPNTFPMKENRFHFNLMDRFAPPAPTCRAYGDNTSYLQVPFVDCYTNGGAPRNIVRLDPRIHGEAIPQAVRDQIGFDPAHTDLFFLLEDSSLTEDVQEGYSGYHYPRASKEFLIKFHHFVFREEAGPCDKKYDVPMGAFPLYGTRKANFWPIAIDHLEPMEVYAHPSESMMLYSPNNAHLQLDTDLPFAIFWIAAHHHGRSCIAKVICRHRDSAVSPALKRLFEVKKGCNHIADLKHRLLAIEPQLRAELEAQFAPFIRTLARKEAHEMEKAFEALPLSYRENIYKQLWIIKGRPSVHSDFGKASFDNDPSLSADYHASFADKVRAVELMKEDIVNELIHSQITLFSPLPMYKMAPTEAKDRASPSSSHPLDKAKQGVAHFEMKKVYLVHSPGLGKKIELRGGFPEGSGRTLKINGQELSWSQGISMECSGSDEGLAFWESPFEIPSIPGFSFKFVVTDETGKVLYWLPKDNIEITGYDQSPLVF